MRVLVLGANGLLGSYLGYSLPRYGFETFGLSRRHVTYFPNLQTRDSVEEFYHLIAEGKFEVVINCVAIASVDECQLNPDKALAINAVSAGQFARAARKSGSRFVQISSDAVFSGDGGGSYSETSETKPANVYGRSKLRAEELVRDAFPDSLILRTNFFSWSPLSDRGVLDFFYRALEEQHEVTGYTDYTVSSIYVADFVEMLTGFLERRVSGTFHVGSESPISKYQFGVHVAKVSGNSASLIRQGRQSQSPNQVMRGRNLSLDSSLARATLGKDPASTWSGIERAFAEREMVMRYFQSSA